MFSYVVVFGADHNCYKSELVISARAVGSGNKDGTVMAWPKFLTFY